MADEQHGKTGEERPANGAAKAKGGGGKGNARRKSTALLKADKSTYQVPEVAEGLAEVTGTSVEAARRRIYRALERGDIDGVRHLGAIRLPNHTVKTILKGHSPC